MGEINAMTLETLCKRLNDLIDGTSPEFKLKNKNEILALMDGIKSTLERMDK